MKQQTIKKLCLAGLSVGLAGLLTGCTQNRETVLAVTGTVIGVQIHQKDTDKTPELKIGYVRSEFDYVPTDKRMDTNAPNGSTTNSANVLMEINAGCNFGLGVAYGGSVYQRLAVGSVAVSQPGAAFMMAKDESGKTAAATAKAVSEAVRVLPPNVMNTSIMTNSVDAYKQYKALPSPEDKAKWDAVISAVTTRTNMADLIYNETPQDWDVVIRALKNRNLMK